MKRTIFFVMGTLGIMTLTLLLFVGCGGSSDPDAAEKNAASSSAPKVRVFQVSRTDLHRKIDLPGFVEGEETADLYAKVGGYIKEMKKDIGDHVTKGEVLAVLNVPEMKLKIEMKQKRVEEMNAEVAQAIAALEQIKKEIVSAEAGLTEAKKQKDKAQAQVSYWEKELNRVQGAVNSGVLRKERGDLAQLKLEEANAAFESIQAKIASAVADRNAVIAKEAKANADIHAVKAGVAFAQADKDHLTEMANYVTIKAPFDGTVTRRWVHTGAFVQPAEGNSAAKPLLTVTRTCFLRIFIKLPHNELRWLDVGDTAKVGSELLPSVAMSAEVKRFTKDLDRNNRTMLVELRLTPPKDEEQAKEWQKTVERIYPGSYVTVALVLETMPNVPVVPASAVLPDDKGKYVYVVENKQTKKTYVTPSYEDGKVVGIKEGLNGGETVVLTGGGQLADDQTIDPVLQANSP